MTNDIMAEAAYKALVDIRTSGVRFAMAADADAEDAPDKAMILLNRMELFRQQLKDYLAPRIAAAENRPDIREAEDG